MTIKRQLFLPFITLIISAAFMLLVLSPLHASAEAHGNFYIPDGAVPQGNQFNITVEFTASEEIGTVSAAVTYNESYMEFVGSDNASGGGGIVNINGFPDSSSTSLSVVLTFRALQEGSAQINMVNGSVMTPDGISLSNAISAYATVTIGAAEVSDSGGTDYGDDSQQPAVTSQAASSQAVLKSLTVETGELKPEFSPGIYDYTVYVSHDVDVFELEGVTGSETDLIWYEGARYLTDGKNQRTITVTSADGLASNVYTVTIYREYADGEGIDSESGAEDSEYEPQDSQAQTVTSAAQTQSKNSTNSPSETESEKSGMEELRDNLMPALYIAMAVIILAVIILIVWIRAKMKKRLK